MRFGSLRFASLHPKLLPLVATSYMLETLGETVPSIYAREWESISSHKKHAFVLRKENVFKWASLSLKERLSEGQLELPEQNR